MYKNILRGFSIVLLMLPVELWAERIKDIAMVAGVRENQLSGYGIVVGLNGTGDQTTQTPFTMQSIQNMLSRYGIKIPENANPQLNNVAAVTIHATLPAFAKPGQKIDVTVSSIGNADSLRGGALLMSPLLGADGQVYALAQGELIVGGFGAKGGDGSSITVNIPSAGRIPNGATVERESPTVLTDKDFITLYLHDPDFTTAQNLMTVLDETFGAESAYAIDATTINVRAPRDRGKKVSFIAVVENLRVELGEAAAKVIINSRTGTVVIGANVRVMPAAVAHGSLIVSISENVSVSQPGGILNDGQTAITTQSVVQAGEDNARMWMIKEGVTLQDLVNTVNRVGASPGDLVAILEALAKVGALRAELLVI
ncbi:MAG: flagellar basal body P-ring protein FlgI [Pseudomonadales bacterium]|nr:flagellar basal body P-ring protein FlgI [Pseudomonadales bacterium]